MTTELSDASAAQTPEIQAEIAAIREQLLNPPKAKNGGLWLIVGLVLFLLTAGERNLWDLAVILAILVIHESGHLLGMKLFGFSDLRMFFIPFFGAAASGRKFGATSFEHAIVLLLGPLPGIVIGGALLIAALFVPMRQLLDAGFMFTVINAFNLIPVSPFDGGRIFERLVFNRRFWLEFLFRILAIVALVGLAFLLQAWIFGLLAFFLFAGFSIQMRRSRAGFALVAKIGHLPSNPIDLTDEQILALRDSVDQSLGNMTANATTMATLRSQSTQEIFDRTSTRFASLTATLVCIGLWAAGLFLSVVNLVIWVLGRNVQGIN
ncbi:MAG: Zn-dependent protease [Planctomycetaceae bacterium]|nr:Zn-dependent protease [Planctomycetaceae bacterium]